MGEAKRRRKRDKGFGKVKTVSDYDSYVKEAMRLGRVGDEKKLRAFVEAHVSKGYTERYFKEHILPMHEKKLGVQLERINDGGQIGQYRVKGSTSAPTGFVELPYPDEY